MAGDMTTQARKCHLRLWVGVLLLAGGVQAAAVAQAASVQAAGVQAVTGQAVNGPAMRSRAGWAAPRSSAMLRQAMLDGHNRARASVGVAVLGWDDGLAQAAQSYADTLARTDRLEHQAQPGGPARQGENLWMGTRQAYRYEDMGGAWVNEARDFRDAAVPAFSRTGRWQDVGHYSQIVWRDTRAVGCATASNGHHDYLVCRYWPAGNVWGQRAY